MSADPALGGRQCGHERSGAAAGRGPVASRRGRLARLRGRRAARGGARRRLLAARRAARPPRAPLAEGRLQPAGPVRLLHRAGRRPAAGGLRDAGPAGRRPAGHHPRRPGRDGRSAGPTRSAPRAPASAGSARRGSSCAWPAPSARGPLTEAAVDQALLAHLCRCTGWQTIREAAFAVAARDAGARRGAPIGGRRGAAGDARGRTRRRSWAPRSRSAGAASPTTPRRSTRSSRCVRSAATWVVGETLAEARAAAGKVQGRRTTVAAALAARAARRGRGPHAAHDVGRARLPGDRRVVVRARRRAGDARWPTAARSAARSPARSATSPAGSPTSTAARCASCSRARTPCAWGPKRPPLAAGVRADGTGVVRVARTPGIAARHRRGGARTARWRRSTWPVRRPRPRCRAAGWAEAAVLLASLRRGAGHGALAGRSRGDRGHRRATVASRCRVRCGRAARRGRAALLLHRRRAHGARLGALGGHRRRRRRASRTTSRSARSASCGRSTRRPSR